MEIRLGAGWVVESGPANSPYYVWDVRLAQLQGVIQDAGMSVCDESDTSRPDWFANRMMTA